MPNWLIYGAAGYTGRLIAMRAAKLGFNPILAGRGENVRALANSLGLQARIFDLNDTAATAAALKDITLVLNCAGPFSATAQPMIAACIGGGVHYLDITGEISVFEHAASLHETAKRRGVVLCPGVGFDVVPTDCVAATLKAAMPDATQLALGFDSRSALSPGTAKTAVEGLAEGGFVRKGGKMTPVPLAYRVRTIDFGFGPKTAMTIPWGDVSTAFHSTGIPDIECYMACPPKFATMTRRMNRLRWLLRMKPVQRLMKWNVNRTVRGPSEAKRASASTAVWGEVRNARGDVCTARIETANGYSLTVDSALAIVNYIAAQAVVEGGYYTPSRLCGPSLVETLPGSGKMVLTHTP
ncbi:MAG: saccharopine dehydrogenase NADP-binding domain-containing protein [Burkholderiales bacterium]|nr:saccharopine dehydrogenase NADP-binding domain-containing protein [Burkholderiales bacterium]